MKKFFWIPALLGVLLFAGCTAGGEENGFINPGDSLGGGGVVTETPNETPSESMENAGQAAGETEKGEPLPDSAVPLIKAGKITESGDYLITGSLEGKISVKAEHVCLFLNGAVLFSADDKVITSDYDLTLTLIGENSAETAASATNAISCDGALTINGGGSLTVKSTKNAVKANTISVTEATLSIEADGDGLHAEIDAYDDLTEAPAFSFGDGGWVKLDGANIRINAGDDGIQADTFVLIEGEGNLDITTNSGAPQTVTESSSDSGDGKGIKAGAIDWGADGNEIVSDEYFIGISGGEIAVNANDDAIHSDGKIEISGGSLEIASGDDGVHAEALLTVTGGEISVTKCYEGLEAAKVEIAGGTIKVDSVDDGINAADGTTNRPGQANTNCHIILSGGDIEVSAQGDGVDSNGTIRMTGGTLVVFGPTAGDNAALDADGGILMDGGYLFAVGPIGMVETPASNSKQNVLSYAQNQAIAANTNLSLTDSDGNALFSVTVRKVCRSVIVSCPELVTGKQFKLYGGDTELCDFTVSSVITSVGSAGNMGNPGGMPPQGPGGGFGRPGGRP